MKFSKNSRIEENSCMDVKKTAHPLGGLYNKFSPKKRNKSNSDEDIDINQEKVNSLLGLDTELDAKEIKELYLPMTELIMLSIHNRYSLNNKINEFLNTETNTPYIIGVAGSVAVGKSTFSKILRLFNFSTSVVESSFGFNSLAIVDNKPKTCSLKDFLENFLKFREDVVIKRTKFDLKKAEERVHILLGLSVSVENIDKVIKIIRSSKNPEEAKNSLLKIVRIHFLKMKVLYFLTPPRFCNAFFGLNFARCPTGRTPQSNVQETFSSSHASTLLQEISPPNKSYTHDPSTSSSSISLFFSCFSSSMLIDRSSFERL